MPFSVSFTQAVTCADQSLSCLKAVDWYSAIDWLEDIDWYTELRLMATSILMSSIIVYLIVFIPKKYPNFPFWNELCIWLGLPDRIQHANPLLVLQQSIKPKNRGRTKRRPPRRKQDDCTRRVVIGDFIRVYAWPSKGGVIIHDHAERVDLEFLGLDPLDPPPKRLPNQNDEDDFCQRLLLTGAKWWDSEARFRFLKRAEEMDSPAFHALEEEMMPIPTLRERRWVSVAWPSTGGLWVVEYDTTLPGILEEDNLLPCEVGRLTLACTMDERSQILQDHFRPTFYKDLSEYKGHAFLNSWSDKENGEVGPLKPFQPMA